MKTKEVSTDRGLFAYREYGLSDSPAVVMVHGWPETSYCWHHVATLLKDRYRSIAIDLRGAGGSNRDTAKSLYAKDQMAQDIYAVINKLGIDDFYLAGHDWGSAVSVNLQPIKSLVKNYFIHSGISSFKI